MTTTSTGSNRSLMSNTAGHDRHCRLLPRVIAASSASILVCACAPMKRTDTMQQPPSLADFKSVSPAFERYTTQTLLGGLWKRPQLSPRDRSIVTLSVTIARGQTVEMPFHLRLALDNGVKPAEISEMIAHLAFYSGWASATAASSAATGIFDERGIGADEVAPAVLPPTPK
jgi:4-carboxymuconolactone decarboxylase